MARLQTTLSPEDDTQLWIESPIGYERFKTQNNDVAEMQEGIIWENAISS